MAFALGRVEVLGAGAAPGWVGVKPGAAERGVGVSAGAIATSVAVGVFDLPGPEALDGCHYIGRHRHEVENFGHLAILLLIWVNVSLVFGLSAVMAGSSQDLNLADGDLDERARPSMTRAPGQRRRD